MMSERSHALDDTAFEALLCERDCKRSQKTRKSIIAIFRRVKAWFDSQKQMNFDTFADLNKNRMSLILEEWLRNMGAVDDTALLVNSTFVQYYCNLQRIVNDYRVERFKQ